MNKALSLWDRVMWGGLILLVIFIPYSPAVTEAGLLIMMVAWMAKRFFEFKVNPQTRFWRDCYNSPYQGLFWSLIAIGAMILFTAPFSHAPMLSLKKFFSRFIQQIFLMCCVVEVINTPKRLYQILAALMLTLVVVNADVFVQYIQGQSFIYPSHKMLLQRVTGPMRHPNDLGTLLVTVIPVILSLLITRNFWIPLVFRSGWRWIVQGIIGVLFLSLVISLGLTSSRGAWLAFVLTMIAFCVCLRRRWVTVFILLMLTFFFWIFGTHCINVRTDISPIALNNSTSIKEVAPIERGEAFSKYFYTGEKVFLNFSRRDEYWQRALDIIKRYPLFGCGYNSYIQTLQKLQLGPVEYPHNSLLQITAELGVLGFLAHLCFFLSLLFYGIQILKKTFVDSNLYILSVGVGASLLAWLIHSVIDTAWESLLLSLLWWFLIGILLSIRTISSQLDLDNKRKV